MKNSRIRVLLIGAAGRMGKTINALADGDPKIDIAARCEMVVLTLHGEGAQIS